MTERINFAGTKYNAYEYVLATTNRDLPFLDAYMWPRTHAIYAAKAVELKYSMECLKCVLRVRPDDAICIEDYDRTSREYRETMERLKEMCK